MEKERGRESERGERASAGAGGDRERSNHAAGAATGAATTGAATGAATTGAATGAATGAQETRPELCLCLWRSHYWSTRPLAPASAVPSALNPKP